MSGRPFHSAMVYVGITSLLCVSALAAASGPVGAAGHSADNRKLLFVHNGGVRLCVETGGEGSPPVILVHGLAGDLTMWDAQLRHLWKSRRAAALDLRGHGRSGRPSDGDYSIPAMASDVLAVADALGMKRFVLVGHSLGGSVILACAQEAPERVAGLLFVDPAGDVTRLPKERLDAMLERMRAPTYLSFMRGWFGANLTEARPSTRRKVFADLDRTPPEVVAASYAGLARFDPLPALRAYRGPMLTVILPGSDRPSSFQNLVPDLPAVRLRGLSHWLMMDDPKGLDRIMDDFLARIG
ncbi:MAG: alpha/beta hydrolase [Acidobacteriota bacterium]